MDSSAAPPAPPVDLPADLARRLQKASVHDLREVVTYAHELLAYHQEPPDDFDLSPGDELVEMHDRQGYTEVVLRQQCGNDCPDCPHGPFLYHVTREPTLDGGHTLHWEYIGTTTDDEN